MRRRRRPAMMPDTPTTTPTPPVTRPPAGAADDRPTAPSRLRRGPPVAGYRVEPGHWGTRGPARFGTSVRLSAGWDPRVTLVAARSRTPRRLSPRTPGH